MRMLNTLVIILILVAPLPARAQSALLVRPDAEALIEIDGRLATAAPVRAWQVYEFRVEPGEHLVTALTPDRRDRWEQVVTVTENSKVFVLAVLASVTKEREAGERASRAGAEQRSEIARLEGQLEELRERHAFELVQMRQATRNAEAARNMPAASEWQRGLNSLVGQIGDSSMQRHQNNAEQLEQQIAILEQRIERLRLEPRF